MARKNVCICIVVTEEIPGEIDAATYTKLRAACPTAVELTGEGGLRKPRRRTFPQARSAVEGNRGELCWSKVHSMTERAHSTLPWQPSPTNKTHPPLPPPPAGAGTEAATVSLRVSRWRVSAGCERNSRRAGKNLLARSKTRPTWILPVCQSSQDQYFRLFQGT